MKAIFQALARYNQSVNQSILELVEPLTEAQIRQTSKAYFPSIFDTLFHILLSDLFWLSRFRDILPESRALAENDMISTDLRNLKQVYEPDYRKIFSDRKRTDETIRQMVDEIDESLFPRTVHYKNYKGEAVEGVLWKILLQWFNHQTHHRGQISVQLDWIDVKNDYSSMLNRI